MGSDLSSVDNLGKFSSQKIVELMLVDNLIAFASWMVWDIPGLTKHPGVSSSGIQASIRYLFLEESMTPGSL